jgi:iron complex outermembrane recepter protein
MNGKRYVLGLCVAAVLPMTTPVYAQSQSGSSGYQEVNLTEVIVTARRVEERAQDVPISMTVYTQQQLDNRNIFNAADLAAYTPSLSANTNFGAENSSYAIRGFVQDAGTQPSVAVYFADVVALRGPTQGTQAGDGAGVGTFFDLQNVQVLKGPQGTLFGRNTTGGAVLFVPQKPTADLDGYVEGSIGNYDMWRVQGMINMPFGDRVRARVAVDHQESNGYLNNMSGIGPKDYNNVDYTAVRASLVVDVTNNVENYTIGSYSKSDNNGSVQKMIGCNSAGYNPVNPALGGRNFIGVFSCSQLADEAARGFRFDDLEAAVDSPRSEIEQWQFINTTTWSATDSLKIKNIASYGEYKDLQASPLFGTNWQVSKLPFPYPFVFFAGIPSVFTGIFPIPGGSSADQSTYTEELQAQGSAMGQRLTYQAGAYFEWSDPLELVGNQSPQLVACTSLATLNCSDPIGQALTAGISQQLGFPFPVHVGSVNYTAGKTSYRDHGLYAQASYGLTDKLKLTGGLRETWDQQTNNSTRITNNFAVLPLPPGIPPAGATATCTDPSSAPSCDESLEKKSNKPTWLIGLDYKPTEEVLVYGKYARGYRAGGVFANAPTDHRIFDPEKVDSYELGLKSTFAPAVHGLFNVAAFYNDFSDQQLQVGFQPRVDPVTGAMAPVSPTTAIVNAGKSRIYGAEVEVAIEPLTGLSFDVSYTYLNATLRSVVPTGTVDPNYQPGAISFAAGDPLVLSPKNKVSATGAYLLPFPASIGHVIFDATYVHTDRQLTNYAYYDPAVVAAFGANYGWVGSTDLVNLNLNWNQVMGAPLDIALFVTNVANKEYYQFIPGLATSGSEYAVLGQPRMYGGRIRWRFGK